MRLVIKPGEGGTDAKLFQQELADSYERFFLRKT